eukprot:320038_1
MHGDDSSKGNIAEIISNSNYLRVVFYIGLTTFTTLMPLIILPAFGAAWFGNCDNSNDNCTYDYETYNLYRSIFASIRATVSLICGAFVSSLSDIYGRKPLLFIRLLIPCINALLIVLYPNLWIYWSLTVFNGFISPGIYGGGPIARAYISDIIHKPDLKTNAFAFSGAVRTFFAIIGSVSAAVITNLSNVQIVWIFNFSVYIFLIIYTICIIKESVSTIQLSSNKIARKHKSFNTRYNPFKPLFYVSSNPIILWVSIIIFFQQMVQVFIPVFLIYVNDQMHIENDGESSTLNMIIMVSIALFGMIYVAVLIPCFKKTFLWATDVNLCIIGCTLQITAPLIWSLIPFIVNNYKQNYYFLCIIIIVCGCIPYAFMAFVDPPLSSIIAKYINDNEHGMAFGILASFRMLATIIGPFGFGYCYNLSNNIGIPSLMNYILSGFTFICLLIVLFPLRQSVKKLEISGEIYTFHGDEKPLMTPDVSMAYAKVSMDDETAKVNNYVTFNQNA